MAANEADYLPGYAERVCAVEILLFWVMMSSTYTYSTLHTLLPVPGTVYNLTCNNMSYYTLSLYASG